MAEISDQLQNQKFKMNVNWKVANFLPMQPSIETNHINLLEAIFWYSSGIMALMTIWRFFRYGHQGPKIYLHWFEKN